MPEAAGGEDDESYDEAIDPILTAAKALLIVQVLGGGAFISSHLSSFPMLDQVLAAAELRTKRGGDAHFTMLTKELPVEATYYHEKVQLYASHKANLKNLAPKMDQAMAILNSPPKSGDAHWITDKLTPIIQGVCLSVCSELPSEFYQEPDCRLGADGGRRDVCERRGRRQR